MFIGEIDYISHGERGDFIFFLSLPDKYSSHTTPKTFGFFFFFLKDCVIGRVYFILCHLFINTDNYPSHIHYPNRHTSTNKPPRLLPPLANPALPPPFPNVFPSTSTH